MCLQLITKIKQLAARQQATPKTQIFQFYKIHVLSNKLYIIFYFDLKIAMEATVKRPGLEVRTVRITKILPLFVKDVITPMMLTLIMMMAQSLITMLMMVKRMLIEESFITEVKRSTKRE